MKNLFLFTLLPCLMLAAGSRAKAQSKYETRTAKVSFRSQTPLEEIYSQNNQVASILKVEGEKKVLAFNVVMRSFKFEKALMEEHFNEKYVHSDQYPVARFSGEMQGDADFTRPGTYKNLTVTGTMVFHGVTRSITLPCRVEVSPAEVKAYATFTINPEEYKIEIPRLVSDKISREILVTVEADYKISK